jgi:hypothetical protein
MALQPVSGNLGNETSTTRGGIWDYFKPPSISREEVLSTDFSGEEHIEIPNDLAPR